MSCHLKQHDDLEPDDIVRDLDPPSSHAFPHTHETIEIEGRTLAYTDTGNRGADHSIVFVHWVPESPIFWRNFIPYTKRQALVTVHDHIGHGISNEPDIEHSTETFCNHFEALHVTLHVRNVILVAQDWGSVVGPFYGANHPDKVLGLVLLEALIKLNYPILEPEKAERDPTMSIAMKHYRDWRAEKVEDGNRYENRFVDRDFMKHTIANPRQRVMQSLRDLFHDPDDRVPAIFWPREMGLGGDRPFSGKAMRKINDWLTENPNVKVLGNCPDEIGAINHLLDRLAEPSEVAEAAAFLAGNRAAFVTGLGLPIASGYDTLGPERFDPLVARLAVL